MLINDQLDPSVPELPNGDPIPPGPNPNGSDATVEVTVLGSRFIGNGNTEGVSVSDNDGLRVNEGGLGDLKLTVRLCVFEENGADGIEADERGDGDALVDMLLTQLRANGPFDEDDLDDGFDIDEWNNGDVVVSVVSSSANDNHEEGFDFNDGHGINFDENRTGNGSSDTEGDLTASVSHVNRKHGRGRARRSTGSAGRRVTPSDGCHGASEYGWGDDGKQRDGYRRSLRAHSRLNQRAVPLRKRPPALSQSRS